MRFGWLMMAVVLVAAGWGSGAVVQVDGGDVGRVFEGIGAVSAGANSRLLIDYEEPYRSAVLDYLFRPKYGAAFQHLKVEMGGGTNSTSGAEPSHAVVRGELGSPVERGYEFWLMAEARARNGEILLDSLPWTYPKWLSGRFSQDSADYWAAFLEVARREYGLELDWTSVAQNEGGTDLNWVVNRVRPTLDAAGFGAVKIQSPDNSWAYWQVFDEFAAHPEYLNVVKAVGYHYIDQKGMWPSAAVIATGVPLWCSEDSVGGGDWNNAREIVARMSRLYQKGRITKMEIWCPVDSCDDGVLLGGVGVMQADEPWTGRYVVRPAVWGVAHWTQFTEPGWVFVDSGCGTLAGAGVYSTLKDPATGDWSVILYAEQAESVTFELTGGLRRASAAVWRSTASEQFVRQGDVDATDGAFTLNCAAGAVYSITTTSGQQKGAPGQAIPAAGRIGMPYEEDFEGFAAGGMAPWYSDMQGTFEVAVCKGGRQGQCLEQIVDDIGITWGYDWCNPTTTMSIVPGEMDWQDYEFGADVYIEGGEAYVAARRGGTQKSVGYALVVGKGGQWRLMFDDASLTEGALARGQVADWDAGAWHRLAVRCVEDQVDAFIDRRWVATVAHGGRASGGVCVGGSFDRNQWDDIEVKAAGPAEGQWRVVDDTAGGLRWTGWWGSWPQAEYYGGSCRFTESVGAAVEWDFSGRVGRLIGSRRSDLGYVDVYVDGVLAGSVDCYSAAGQYQAVLFETGELAAGGHTMRVVVTGEKNAASSGHEVVLDAFSAADRLGTWCPREGGGNLAAGAAVRASSVWGSGYEAAKGADGDFSTRWNSAAGDEMGSWLELDLGREVLFDRVLVQQYDERVLGYAVEYYGAGGWQVAYLGREMGEGLRVDRFGPVVGSKVRLRVTETTTVPSIYEFQVPAAVGDLSGDGVVDLADVAVLAGYWLGEGCSGDCGCDRADLWHDGVVDWRDWGALVVGGL